MEGMNLFVPNLNVKLRAGGRKSMRLSIDDFVRKYKEFCDNIRNTQDYDDWWITDEDADEVIMYGKTQYKLPVILGDKYVGRFKIIFDMENYSLERISITSTGIPYLATWYGGDWEVPMLVFYYFDNEGRLRNYIPTKGNTYSINFCEEDFETRVII